MIAAMLAATTTGATMATIGAAPAQARAQTRVAPHTSAGVVVTPSTGLTDGQTVDVNATGLTPNGAVVVGQCAVTANPDPGHCDGVNFVNALATAAGTLDVPYVAHAAFAT